VRRLAAPFAPCDGSTSINATPESACRHSLFRIASLTFAHGAGAEVDAAPKNIACLNAEPASSTEDDTAKGHIWPTLPA
jgi:hypothetical protein